MLSAYPHASASEPGEGALVAQDSAPIWIDLFDPTEAEVASVQDSTHIRVPRREDISEIESTSRLYIERGTLYLSTPLITRSEEAGGGLTATGFVLSPSTLVTIRYERVGAFDTVRQLLDSRETLCSADVFTHILEAVVDRAADLLERIGAELDVLSRETFMDAKITRASREDPLRQRLRKLGVIGDRLSQVRDALLGVGRIAPFVSETAKAWTPPDVQARLGAVRQDIGSLNDYEGHLSTKVQFLLDAVLGFISIEQNDVVKVLTIASTVGVPPVLVVGVYGMNFKFMPELEWRHGYPYAIALMLLSAVVPLLWFRFKRWL